jgi:hypothetical protein
MELVEIVVQAFVTAAAAWAAVRVELRWLRRDVDHAHERIDRHDQQLIDLLQERR